MPVRDARVQPRHWFREDSKKYMTVEMEQPFVWPEVPDLAPWSPAVRQKEFEDSETMSGASNHEMQRESARDLRKKVEMLFKREQPLSNDAIARKKEAGLELTPAEKAMEEQRLAKEARLQAMSRIKMWEAQRSVKVVESDERSKFTIKA
jgi:large subunit ribosomal protein L23